MTQTTIVKTVFLKASPQTVWDFLTNKDKLGQWFHPPFESLEKDKEFMLMGKDDNGDPVKICWGTVKYWNPHSQLEYSFTIKPLGGIMTHVKWTLEEVGSGTRITVEHSGLEAAGDAFGIVMALDSGWDKHFAQLRDLTA